MMGSNARPYSANDPWRKGFDMIGSAATRDLGFELLIKLSRGAMSRYLRDLEGPLDDHEDIVSCVAIRLWESRETREYPTLPSFLAFVKRATKNELIDRRRSAYTKQTTSLEVSEEASSDDSVEFMRRLGSRAEDHALLQVADNLWLGKKASNYQLRMLAATLIFRDKKRLLVVMEALKKLNRAPQDIDPVWLLKWVTDKSILRRLSYSVMHYRPEDVFKAVVDSDHKYSNEDILLLWKRFVRFEPKGRLMKSIPEDQHAKVKGILEAHEAKLPFSPSFESMISNVRRHDDQIDVFSEEGLWKRLLFQYSVYNLPRDDMHQWFEKPASLGKFSLGKNQIHGWISNGRLRIELEKACESGEWQ
jgi:Sigma-70 region 2